MHSLKETFEEILFGHRIKCGIIRFLMFKITNFSSDIENHMKLNALTNGNAKFYRISIKKLQFSMLNQRIPHLIRSPNKISSVISASVRF